MKKTRLRYIEDILVENKMINLINRLCPVNEIRLS